MEDIVKLLVSRDTEFLLAMFLLLCGYILLQCAPVILRVLQGKNGVSTVYGLLSQVSEKLGIVECKIDLHAKALEDQKEYCRQIQEEKRKHGPTG